MKQKFKNTQKGITLVALIITIIVLLILAMVSIKIAIDEGLITKASKATDTHTIAAEKEAIQLGYSTYQMDLAQKGSATLAVEGSSTITPTSDGGWDIAFKVNNYHLDKNGNITEGNGQDANVPTEDLEYLKKELEGNAIVDIASISGSGWDIQTIEFNNQNIKFLYRESYFKYYIVYNRSMYTITASSDSENGKSYNSTHIINVEYVNSYTIKGKDGQKVEYSYDGTDANKKEWTVLYDNGDTLEIISPEAIGNLKLGKDDTETQGSSDFEKAIYSYNNAIDRINNYTASLVTNSNKISVRSVGSNPNNPSYRNTTKYRSDISKIDGKIETGDNNYKEDVLRMSVLGETATGNIYWLASRYVYDIWNVVYIEMSAVSDSGILLGCIYNNNVLLEAGSNNNYAYSYDYAVRPVVKVNASSVQIKD